MVVIRKLSPSIRIELPQPYGKPFNESKVHVVRRRVDHPPPTPQATPCVLWQGSVDVNGYGRRKAERHGRRVTVGVHRWVVEEVLERTLQRGEFVMHLCDNRLCFRYDHLQVGTAYDNNRDMVNKGRLVHVANSSPGERNGNAKLSARQVEHIRQLYESGLLPSTIADQYGISVTTARRIVRGLSWRHHPVDLLADHRQEDE